MSWKATDDCVQYLELTDGRTPNQEAHQQHLEPVIGPAGNGMPIPFEVVARIRFELVGWGNDQDYERPEVNTHRVRLSAFIERYITDYLQLKARKSLRQEINRLRIVQRLLDDDLYIDEITTNEIEQLLVGIVHSGRSTATYNRYRARLHSLFRKAIDWGYRPDNPVKCVERLRESPIGDRYLTFDEFRKLLDACDCELRPFVHLAAVTGIRQGALLEVRWEDIEPDLTFITVRAETTKTGEPRRVPLNQEAREVLGEIGLRPSGRVFTFERFPRSRWNRVREKLGWDSTEVRRLQNWRFHDLRHCCASWLVMADVPLYKIAKILGHKQLTTTQRYAHLTDSSLADAMERINSDPSKATAYGSH